MIDFVLDRAREKTARYDLNFVAFQILRVH